MHEKMNMPNERESFFLFSDDDGIVKEITSEESNKDYGNWVPLFGVEGRDMWLDYNDVSSGSINNKDNWRLHRRGQDKFQFSTTGSIIEYGGFDNITKFAVHAIEGEHREGHPLFGPYYGAINAQDYKFYYHFWLDTTYVNQNDNLPVFTIDFSHSAGIVINSYTYTAGMLKNGYHSYSLEWLFRSKKSYAEVEARIYWHGRGEIYVLQTMMAHVY
jgi:hypothetical protein